MGYFEAFLVLFCHKRIFSAVSIAFLDVLKKMSFQYWQKLCASIGVRSLVWGLHICPMCASMDRLSVTVIRKSLKYVVETKELMDYKMWSVMPIIVIMCIFPDNIPFKN